MSRRYSVAEAKNHLPAMLHEVERGEPVEITRHGRPVAIVLSVAEYARLQGVRPDLWEAYQSWRQRRTGLTDGDVDSLIDRDRDRAGRGIDW